MSLFFYLSQYFIVMIAQTIIELESVDSTNLYANQLLAKGDLHDGTVIWAHQQHAGRGQNENVWYSDAGKNLTFTIVLYPRFLEASQQFRLNKAISLGVLDFIHTRIKSSQSGIPASPAGSQPPQASIKWPNDIFVGTCKVAGILIENRIMGSNIDTSVVGIGININQERFIQEADKAGSLIHFIRKETDLKQALTDVCRSLEIRYSHLYSGYYSRIDGDYCAGLMGYRSNRKFLVNGNEMEGFIEGVDDMGRLQIRKSDLKTISFNHKEVEYLF